MKSVLLELALSLGLYYLLRAFGVDVFWALTAPAIAVGAVAAAVTVHRGRVDMIGLLVLCELGLTIATSLVTRSPLVAALREPGYFLVGGAFCLVTLLHRVPFSHAFTAKAASFGNPEREEAFAHAWQSVPRYRFWQRLLTVAYGVIMIGSALVRGWLLCAAADLAHAADASNVLGLVTIAALVATAAVLVQPARKIIDDLLAADGAESNY
jgi:hypothetical protein